MPDTYTVFTTNEPEAEKTVGEAELTDLIRQGLVVTGKGDIGPKGTLKRALAEQASPEVATATGPVPTLNQGA
jgi:hypothetical protein